MHTSSSSSSSGSVGRAPPPEAEERPDPTRDELAALADKADRVADLLAALANRTRLMALCRMTAGEVCVGDLAICVGASQSALSQYLARLRALGLVSVRREGQTIFYRLASKEARELIATLHRLYCR